MTKPLLAILLLLPLSVSAGELDGRGIICHLTPTHTGEPRWRWYEFKDNHVRYFSVVTKNTSAEVVTVEEGKYSAWPGNVHWWGDAVKYDLNRKTLKLAVFYEWSDKQSYWYCEASESLEAFTESIETSRLRRQNSINEEMKDNQI